MTDAELARSEIARTLEGALDGRVSFIEAARTVNSLVELAGFDRLSEPFITFIGVDSETDAVPIGEVRDLWLPDAVEKNRPEWERAEAWAKEISEGACRDVLALLRAA